jgi:hypothetical protein
MLLRNVAEKFIHTPQPGSIGITCKQIFQVEVCRESGLA